MRKTGLLRRSAPRNDGVSEKQSAPVPRLTVITLGVSNMRASIAFYEAIRCVRENRATGRHIAFFDTGGTVLALFPWNQLAQKNTIPKSPRPKALRGMTLAWNCRTTE